MCVCVRAFCLAGWPDLVPSCVIRIQERERSSFRHTHKCSNYAAIKAICTFSIFTILIRTNLLYIRLNLDYFARECVCVCTHTHTHIYPAICMREYTHTYVACRTAFGIGIYLLYCLASVWRGGGGFRGDFSDASSVYKRCVRVRVCVFLRHAACRGLRGPDRHTRTNRLEPPKQQRAGSTGLSVADVSAKPSSALCHHIIIIIVIDSLNHACALISRYV